MKITNTSPAAILAHVAHSYPDIDLTLAEVRANVPSSRREIAKYQAAALYQLARAYNRTDARILEIGTAWGYSAAVMSSAAPLAEIVTLNPNNEQINGKPSEVDIAFKNLAHYPNVHIEVAKSWDFLKTNPGKFDLIFVDGDHARVRADLPFWELVNDGGLFLFHDYSPAGATEGKGGHKRECPPVYAAVNEFAQGLGREPDVLVVDDGGVGMAGFYKQAVPVRTPRPDEKYTVEKAVPYSILGFAHLQALFDLGHRVQDMDGAIVEAGCGNGGSAAVLYAGARRKVKPIARELWVYDSFSGVPTAGDKDSDKAHNKQKRPAGWCMADEKKVWEIAGLLKIPKKQMYVGAGEFEQSFAAFQTGPVALLHVDATLYRSTKLALATFYERVLPGGIITVSAYAHWSGVKAAVDEFLSEHSLRPVLLPIDRGNVWWQK